ncbi:MAG: HD domain-containing phosphohydrolase [Acidobacteriota bacterium]
MRPHRLSELTRACRFYVLIVSAVGLCVAGFALVKLYESPVSYEWFTLAALTLLTGTFTVRIPGIPARLSVSDTFVFASVLLFGPEAGTITVLLDALIISLRLGHHTRAPFRVVFNVSVAAVSTWAAAHVFFGLSGIPPYSIEHTQLGRILLPLLLFTLTYFLLNSWLVTFALALEQGRPPIPIWKHNFLWLSVNYFGGASVAALLVSYTKVIDLSTLGIIVPLLLISYLTFKTSLGRIEDANKHLKEVNQLYLSTIETLAMAIDAKDQITHGHIRRVQQHAVSLARALGVKDERQIKAIEAAALLHDMGKLAIPEYILNKPGKLSPDEFAIMKTHAAIGADILSSIAFPYPVVPIVRHHHESWDGSGYPAGLKGTAIPLGARVLSVVDCFDALTSDRPYRPKVSASDAFAVLLQRRGTMYDPLVVDTFINGYQEVSLALPEGATSPVLKSISARMSPQREPSGGDGDAVTALRAAFDFLGMVSPTSSGLPVNALGDILSERLRIVVPHKTIVLFGLDSTGTALEERLQRGAQISALNGVRIPLGQRLSGWVAANQNAIWNSDAALDCGAESAEAVGVKLCSSIPLLHQEALVGVFSLYGTAEQEVSLSQRYLLEAMARPLAVALAQAERSREAACIDARSGPARECALAVLDAYMSHGRNQRASANGDSATVAVITCGAQSQSEETERGSMIEIQANLVQALQGRGYLLRVSDASYLAVSAGPLSGEGRTKVDEPLATLCTSAIQNGGHRTAVFVRELRSAFELRGVLKDGSTLRPTWDGGDWVH